MDALVPSDHALEAGKHVTKDESMMTWVALDNLQSERATLGAACGPSSPVDSMPNWGTPYEKTMVKI